MSLLLAVQKIELVGDEQSWVQEWSALILAVAAITAAALAAYVAIHNQRRQLDQDRLLRNQDHTRDTIDSALLTVNEARDTMDNLMAGVQTLEQTRREGEEPSPETEKMVEGYRETAINKMHAMRGAQARLETRLGDDDPVVATHNEAFLVFHTLLAGAHGGILELREEEISAQDAAREKAVHDAFGKFQKACHEWFKNSAA